MGDFGQKSKSCAHEPSGLVDKIYSSRKDTMPIIVNDIKAGRCQKVLFRLQMSPN